MKKLQFVIICLFCSMHAMGQEVMHFTMPKGAIKLNEKQSKGLIHNGFNEKAVSDFHDHIYKKDGVLLYYLNLSSFPEYPERRLSLESKQKTMVALLSGESELKGGVSVVDSSGIVIVNNVRFSIIEYHEKNLFYINFTSDYDKNGGFINGFIEFKKTDEAEAKLDLHELLQTMHFRSN